VKKIALITLGVVILMMWGVTMVFVKRTENKQQTLAKEQTAEAASGSGKVVQGQLLEVLKAGSDITCSYEQSDKASLQRGTIYVSGVKYRGDFEVGTGSKIDQTHLIGDGEWYYVWTNGATQAFKLNITQLEGQGATNSAAKMLSGYSKLGESTKLACENWKANPTMFVAPTDYYFIDMTEKLIQLKKSLKPN
jgi:hypothetical protein